MSFDDLLIGFFQFIQKRCDRRAAVKHPGFLDIDIVDRDMECRRQGTDDLDETRLAVAVHDNPVFMKGNGKLQQLLLRPCPQQLAVLIGLRERIVLVRAIFRTIADDIDFAIQNIHDFIDERRP